MLIIKILGNEVSLLTCLCSTLGPPQPLCFGFRHHSGTSHYLWINHFCLWFEKIKRKRCHQLAQVSATLKKCFHPSICSLFRIFKSNNTDDFQISRNTDIVCCTGEIPNKFQVADSSDGRSMLTVNGIIGLDEAYYRCRRNYGTNTVADDPNTYEIEVISLVTSSNFDISISTGTSNSYVYENSYVTLTCTVFDVKPEPSVFWTQLTSPGSDTFTIISGTSSSGAIVNDNGLFNRTATVSVRATRNMMFDILKCRAVQNFTNNLHETAANDFPVTIDVYHGPTCDTSKVTKFAAEVGSSVNATCYIDLNPMPTTSKTCYWKDSTTSSTKLATVDAVFDNDNYIISASYNYSIDSTNSYKNLYCYCDNINQQSSCTVQVVEPGVPDPPTQCRQSNTTSYSMMIVCDEAFDGGYTPYFALDEMGVGKTSESSATGAVVAASTSTSSITLATRRLYSGATVPEFYIASMQSESTYLFRVCATNEKFSDMQQCTEVFTVYTVSGIDGSAATSAISWWILLAAIGGGLLLIILIVVLVFLLCAPGKEKEEEKKPEVDVEGDSGVQPSISGPILTSAPPMELENLTPAGDKVSTINEHDGHPHLGDGQLAKAVVAGAVVGAAVAASRMSSASSSSSDSHRSHPIADAIEDARKDDHPIVEAIADGRLSRASSKSSSNSSRRRHPVATALAVAAVANAVHDARRSSSSSSSSNNSFREAVQEAIEERRRSPSPPPPPPPSEPRIGDGHVMEAMREAAREAAKEELIRKSSSSSSSSSSSNDSKK